LETELTTQAEADLVEIGNFIAKDNPSVAERYIRRLRNRIEVLREFPKSGHRIRKRSNVRALVERPIIIVYALKPTGSKFCVSGMEREVGRKSVKLPDLTGSGE
jgi:plasmid stabilization system protein ParE